MKQRKLLTSLFLAATLSISLLTGCGNTSSSTSETKQTENSVTEEQTTSVQKESETDENQEAADQLLCDLKGTYQELWPVILADEPTSALDVTTQAQIVRQMMELREDYGTGIIVVTHNLGVAAYMSDYVVVMKDGHIEDQGDRDHILHHSENAYTRRLLSAVPSMGGESYV